MICTSVADSERMRDAGPGPRPHAPALRHADRSAGVAPMLRPSMVAVTERSGSATEWRSAVRRAAERPGRSLDDRARSKLAGSDRGFDNLHAVRVHTDDAAAHAAEKLSARA